MAKEPACRDCGHLQRQHSVIGCLYNGKCPYNCMVKFTDKHKFD